MNIRVISYATLSHRDLQSKLNEQCKQYGIDTVSYNEEWLKKECTALYTTHEDIFKQERGAGYWLWKPIIILDAVHKFPDDIILYLDSSVMFTEDPRPFFATIDGFAAMQSSYVQRNWTKRDCFHYMYCDNEKYWDAMHVWAGALFASIKDIHYLNEWFEYASRPEILTDAPNTCGLDNLPGFRDHRHDQSILSNIVVRYNLPTVCSHIFIDR